MDSDSDWRTWSFAQTSPRSPPPAEHRALGRYALLDPLTPGANGVIWRARDELTGERVIVKLVPSMGPAALAGVRREVTALRWLRLPGVVRMLDDGAERGSYALVMEEVIGSPFPGLPRPVSWEALAPRAFDLLRALEGVHRAGVMHRDLKPANVLVTPAGRVVLLDFGLAHGRALAKERGAKHFAGTPAYAAPEQFRGVAGPAADLFAVGVMLFEALAGKRPWLDGSFNARRAGETALPIRRLAPGVPAAVAEVIDRLLWPRPEGRFDDAAEVAAALGAPSVAWTCPSLPDPLPSPEALRDLFLGPDTFLHLRQDAAELLFRRSGGSRAAAERLIGEWLDAGDLRWEGDRLVVDRPTLIRLEHWGDFSERLGAGTAPESLIPEVAQRARALLDEGKLGEAAALLELGLGLVRQANDAGIADLATTEAELLRLTAITALGQESVLALDRALYALGRAGSAVEHAERLASLLQGERAARRGEMDRALDLLDVLDPLEDEELESWRQVARLRALAPTGTDVEEAALAVLDGWAKENSFREAKVKGWRGNLRFRQGRFEEAARLHLESARQKQRPDAVLSSLVNAAAATLEALDLDRSEALAGEVKEQARTLRHAAYEANATWTQRATAYRKGALLEPAPELIDAAVLVDEHLEGQFAIQEACFAWRRELLALAEDLAVRARARFETESQPEMAGLCEALAAAAAGAVSADRQLALTALAREASVADFGVQIIGLLRQVSTDPDPRWPAFQDRLARSRPQSQWNARLDVLSFAEAGLIPKNPEPDDPQTLHPVAHPPGENMSDTTSTQPTTAPEEIPHQPVRTRPGRGLWDNSFQLSIGTSNIHQWKTNDPADVQSRGTVYTRTAATTRRQNPGLDWDDDIEQWLSPSPATLFSSGVLELRASASGDANEEAQNRLTAATLAQHQGKKLALLRFQYKAFPSKTQIAALPDTVADGREASSYWVWSKTPGNKLQKRPDLDPENATGALYREVDSATGAVRDLWVLFSTYQMPSPLASTWIAEAATGWTSQRNFLQKMEARGTVATTGWYVSIGGMDTSGRNLKSFYTWIDLPAEPPEP